MVWPEREVTTSPGLQAPPPGRFSTAGTTDTTLRGRPSSAAARTAPEHARRPAHVELHLVHGRGRLDGDAAGIERHPLSDQHDRGFVRRPSGVLDDDELRRLPASARDREQGAHAELAHPLLLEDLGGHRLELLREGGGALGEMGRRAHVAGPVAEVSGEALPGVDRRRFGDGPARPGAGVGTAARRMDRDAPEAGAGGRVLLGLALAESVHRIAVGFRHRADPPGFVAAPDLGLGLGEEVRRPARPGARDRSRGRPGRPPEGAVVEGRARSEAHEHDPLGRQAGRGGARARSSRRPERGRRPRAPARAPRPPPRPPAERRGSARAGRTPRARGSRFVLRPG